MRAAAGKGYGSTVLTMVIRRFGVTLATIFVASFVLYAILYLIPGNPAVLELGTRLNPQLLAQAEKQLGLNVPWYVSYWHWLGHAITGNFGNSYVSNLSVTGLISSSLAETIELGVGGILVGLILGVPAGLAIGSSRGRVSGHGWDVLVATGMGLPVFWVGLVLQLVLALNLHAFPATGYSPIGDGLGANLSGMVLPCLALGFGLAAINARFVAAGVREVLESPLHLAAEALGLPRLVIAWRVLLRYSLIQLVTILGLELGYAMGGVVLVEQVFNLPGLGSLLWNAVQQRDYSVIQAVVLLAVVLFAVINFIVDVLYGVIDPRIRATGSA